MFIQPPTLHCPLSFLPTAIAVSSSLTPSVCPAPAATWSMSIQPGLTSARIGTTVASPRLTTSTRINRILNIFFIFLLLLLLLFFCCLTPSTRGPSACLSHNFYFHKHHLP